MPGLVPALGLVVVERERPDLLVERDAGARLDGLADPGVEVTTAAIGQALVGRVADQGVAEAKVARRLLLEQVAEPRPHLVVELDVLAHRATRSSGSKLAPSTEA